MAGKVRHNSNISDNERIRAIEIIDKVIEVAPDLLYEIDEIEINSANEQPEEAAEITIELIEKMVAWDKKNKRLKDHHFRYMWNVANGKQTFDDRAKKYAEMNLKTLKRFGFEYN